MKFRIIASVLLIVVLAVLAMGMGDNSEQPRTGAPVQSNSQSNDSAFK